MQEVHFVIDEAGTVLRGSMPAIEEGLVIGRSYGLRLNFFFQSMAQLNEAFHDKASVVLDNCDTIYFGIKSYPTAEFVSKQLGSATITVEDANEGSTWNRTTGQPSDSSSRSSGRSWREQGRSLALPEEILNYHPDLMLAFIRGVRPIICWRVKWYQDRRFGGAAPGRWLGLPGWWLLMAVAAGLIIWALCN